MVFSEADVIRGYDQVRARNEMLITANRIRCGGNFVSLDGVGAKLVISEVGTQDKLIEFHVSEFVNSPTVWIAEGNVGRWAGLQAGWPPTHEEFNDEITYESYLIARDRRRQRVIEDERFIELMVIERDGHRYWNSAIRNGWLQRAKIRFKRYRYLQLRYPLLPESIAWWIARHKVFNLGVLANGQS